MYLRCLKFGAVVVLLAGVLCACEREERRFTEDPAASQAPNSIALSGLQPGTTTGAQESPYEYNAYAIAQGKQLFEWFNCSGCHAQGGGAIGPALMDAQWIYGDQPQNIFSTIVEGRPNGMPSFRGRIPTQQVWQLVAYVRSLSGLVPKTNASTRGDHMNERIPQQPPDAPPPQSSSTPPSAEQ